MLSFVTVLVCSNVLSMQENYRLYWTVSPIVGEIVSQERYIFNIFKDRAAWPGASTSAAAAKDDDEDIDLFGSDSEDEEKVG